MFRRLRLRLTAICAMGTAAVLVAMAGFALFFSIRQLEDQAWEAFRSNANAVQFQLRSQPVLDQAWLARMEADNGLLIRVESRKARIQYTHQEERRERLTAEAVAYAENELGFEPFTLSGGRLEPVQLLFPFPFREEGDFMACVSALALGEEQVLVAILKDRGPERATAGRLAVGFAVAVAAAVGLLVAFAWFFSGRATRPVEEAHQKQVDFVSAASHELRSPLAVIELSAGTIRSAPDQAAGLAGKIEAECRRMARLIGDLLFLARADRRNRSAGGEEASAKTMLLSVLERWELLAEQRGIRLELDLAEESLPPVRCSREQGEQVLSVFLDNALQYTPAGGLIRLRGYRRRSEICLAVGDSGPGIPEEAKAKVFDRFYRGDSGRSDKEHYGLGLSIAAELAAWNGGRLSVGDSALGGAEFTLRLPVAKIM